MFGVIWDRGYFSMNQVRKIHTDGKIKTTLHDFLFVI